jgi:hypothetical protein
MFFDAAVVAKSYVFAAAGVFVAIQQITAKR